MPLQFAAGRSYRGAIDAAPQAFAGAGAEAWSVEPVVWSKAGRFGGGQRMLLTGR